MRRAAALLPFAAFLLLAVWLLRLGQETWSGDGPGLERGAAPAQAEPGGALPTPDEQVPDPTLVGRVDAQPPAPPRPQVRWLGPPQEPEPSTLLRGRVGTVEGLVPPGAEVWAVPHARSEGTDARGRTTSTLVAADGSFVLPVFGLADSYVGARAPGCAVAFLDGAALSPEREVEFLLEPAHELLVRVLDLEGEPLPDVVLRAVPATAPGAVPRYPGPDAPLATQVEGTDEHGQATFVFERNVPVTVGALELLTEPGEGRAARLPATVVLRARRPARLVLEVFDGDSLDYLAESIHVEVYAAGEDRALTTFASDAQPDVIEADLALPPGRYDLEVTARGREPVLVGGLVIGTEGSELRVVVHMDALAPQVLLALELQGGAGLRLPPGHALRPTALVRRTDGGWASRGWQAHDPFVGGEDGLSVPLRPGTYDVMLLLPETGEVATVQGVDLTQGDRRVPLSRRPGTTFRLYDVLPADVEVAVLTLEAEGWGRVAPVGHRASALRDSEDLLRHIHPAGTAARGRPESGPVLGPYPSARVTVTVEDPDGRVYRFVAP